MGISLHVVVFDGRMLGHLESRVMDQYRDLRICVLLRCVLKGICPRFLHDSGIFTNF